jgi:hypothetical protein
MYFDRFCTGNNRASNMLHTNYYVYVYNKHRRIHYGLSTVCQNKQLQWHTQLRADGLNLIM